MRPVRTGGDRKHARSPAIATPMTLATVPRYDRSPASARSDRAVILGGSIAGLVAARVLADRFERVTVIDRDSVPGRPTARRGVPQGDHLHLLLEAGRATIEDFCPGYGETLCAAGGLMIDMSTDAIHFEGGEVLADGPKRLPTYCASRPLFEQVLRDRVSDKDGVELWDRTQVTDYCTDGTTDVDGVLVRTEDGEQRTLTADLVVDATGRTSRTPAWLAENGYTPPPVEEVQIGLAYSTVCLGRPADDRRAFFIPPDPPRTRGAGAVPIEDDRWLVTFFGVHGDHPPTDADGLRAFAASLPIPDLAQLLESQAWLSETIAAYPFPSSRRYRYEELDRFPDGLVVVGDAIASFNPIYGQGMSVAALEALALAHVLTRREDVPRRFFDRAGAIVDGPWSIVIGGDFAFPETTGEKPRGTDLFNRYMDRLIRSAHTDGTLRDALYRVFRMEQPPESLLRPHIAWRVLRPDWAAIDSISHRRPTLRTSETR